jgi:hypothetical protein
MLLAIGVATTETVYCSTQLRIKYVQNSIAKSVKQILIDLHNGYMIVIYYTVSSIAFFKEPLFITL